MPEFKVLNGLPPYGPPAKPFPVSGYRFYSEGYVIEFNGGTAGAWVGNFQPGLTEFSGAYEHPDGKHILVVSGGDIYIVDPELQTAEDIGGMVESVTSVPELKALLFAEGTHLSLIGLHRQWRTRQLSCDGIRDLSITGNFAVGEGWQHGNTWHKFSVSLDTGDLEGGAYHESEP